MSVRCYQGVRANLLIQGQQILGAPTSIAKFGFPFVQFGRRRAIIHGDCKPRDQCDHTLANERLRQETWTDPYN